MSLPAKPRARSLFYPSGPITAKHTKNREMWLSSTADEAPVWPKSGPPTREARFQKGEVTKPLLDAQHPARLTGRAIVELRRDLNVLAGKKGGKSAVGHYLSPDRPAPPRGNNQVGSDDARDDWSDDELWESLGRSATTPRGHMRKSAITRLVATRCLDNTVASDSVEAAQIADKQQLSQPQQTETMQEKAFRSVVKDDVNRLTEALNEVPMEVWSAWQNRGKQNLAAMAEGRNGRSSACYVLLAKKLGLPLGEQN